ncbi:CdaR family transcriptional regulator [Bacillus daqingensis]|uniref:CdaR family transcriptional regulator n=1 Tax=Bacillus daqingensis TaxID=872396 RepID=A0ABV9NPI3_9BACI
MITSETAQQIVARTMEILPYNINVIRPDGTIIGSGNASRIGTVHEAARVVREKGTVVEITKEEEGLWEGAVQGINLPAFQNGALAAVIGITGPPDDVRSFGRLVVMTAEMMMEQAVLLREIQVDERMREEAALQLLDAEQSSERLAERLQRLNISMDGPRTVICFTDPEPEHVKQTVQPILYKDELFCVRQGRLLVIARAGSEREIHVRFRSVSGFQAAAGPPVSVHDLPQAAELALAAASLPNQHESFLLYRDVDLEVLLYKSGKMDKGVPPWPLDEELTETLSAYVAQNGRLQDTAAVLHIHRNTLQYRLGRIREKSGRDPRKLKELLYLYADMLRTRSN